MLREAAATRYLNLQAARHWGLADKAWCGALLGAQGLFQDTRDDNIFVSLGFHGWVTLALPLQQQTVDNEVLVYYDALEATKIYGKPFITITNHSCRSDCPLRGLVTEPCRAEAGLSRGIIWMLNQPSVPLPKYMLLRKFPLTVVQLRLLCQEEGIRVRKLVLSKGITKAAYVKALVGKQTASATSFPGFHGGQQDQLQCFAKLRPRGI